MTIPLRKGPGVKHPFKIHPHQLDREGKCWQLFRTLQLLEAFDAFEYCQQQLYTDNSCIMSAQNGSVWWRSLPFNWRGLLTAAVKSVSCHTGLIPLHADILYLPWRLMDQNWPHLARLLLVPRLSCRMINLQESKRGAGIVSVLRKKRVSFCSLLFQSWKKTLTKN